MTCKGWVFSLVLCVHVTKCKCKIGTAEWIVFLLNRSLGKRGGIPVFHLHVNLTNWYYCLAEITKLFFWCLEWHGPHVWSVWNQQEIMESMANITNKALERRRSLASCAYFWLEDQSEFMKQFLLCGHGLASIKMSLTNEVPQQPPIINCLKSRQESN